MKQVTAYNLACGGVQREEINGYWIELYRESNCYHVRRGKIGEKWSIWESVDCEDKKSLTLAHSKYNEIKHIIDGSKMTDKEIEELDSFVQSLKK